MIPSGKTKTLLLIAGIAFATSTSAVSAAEFSDIDSNGDDVLSLEEFQGYFGDKIGKAAFTKYNTDKCESDSDCVEGVTADEIQNKSSEQGRKNSSAGMKRAYENQQQAKEIAAAGREKAENNRGGGNGKGRK
ncbi:hypothetical protein [Aliiroseovarius sp. S253]|uniref:hypothetical protein n=1 Tax=Aliiroseovarius sp. S253 TaxID=3415133 RepID=UPI003C7C04CD